jgi:HD-GYP domain-containing protein (c-di-GMP phosphodiesterase class II)
MPHEQAVGIIRAQRGTHFDPDVVDAFVAGERDIEAMSRCATDCSLNPEAVLSSTCSVKNSSIGQ